MTPMATGSALTAGGDAHGDRPLAVAVAASLLLHACVVAGLASVVLGDQPALIRRDVPGLAPAIRAILVSPPSPTRDDSPTESPQRDSPGEPLAALHAPATAAASVPPSASRNESPRAGSAAGVRGVVEMAELRGSAPLGGEFDRRMAEEFAADPDQLVQLKPGASFGYPEEALAAGDEGHVLLWVVVGPNGDVEEKEALDGAPPFAEHVLARIDGMIAAPAMVGGRAIRHWLALDIVFAIRPDEQDGPGAASTEARVR